jgi:hypothetical protein
MSINQSQRIANIRLKIIDSFCKIEISYSRIKEVTVYIPESSVNLQDDSYRTILCDLVSLLEFHEIGQVTYQNEIPSNIIRLFIGICRQLSRKIHKDDIVDEMGNFLYARRVFPPDPTVNEYFDQNVVQIQQHTQSAENLPRPVHRSITDLIHTLATGNVNRDRFQSLMGDLGSSLLELGVNGISARRDGTYQTDRIRSIGESQTRPRPISDEVRYGIDLLRNVSPVRPDSLQPTPLLRRHHVEYEPNPTHEVNPNILSNPPPRFVENRHGATREITELTSAEGAQLISPTDLSIDEMKADLSEHIASIQRTTSQRTSVSDDTIDRIAEKINNLIISGKSKHPHFTNKSKSGYQRIKNYIHNITHTWLSRDEIDSFLEKISTINPNILLVSDTA